VRPWKGETLEGWEGCGRVKGGKGETLEVPVVQRGTGEARVVPGDDPVRDVELELRGEV